MAPPANHIRVPKPSAKSFNPNRLITKNALIENQVRHLHELELTLRKQLQDGIQFEDVKTEGDAAKYIRKITEILHPHLGEGKKR